MDLGATVCTRARPRCDVCPVAADCVARIDGRIAELPAPRPAKALPHARGRVLVIERAGEILLEQRPAPGIWGGLWSLPEVALDDDRARRRCASASASTPTSATTLPPIEHGFTHFTLTMHPQRVACAHGRRAREAPGMRVADARTMHSRPRCPRRSARLLSARL